MTGWSLDDLVEEWWVVCREYEAGPYDHYRDADRRLNDILQHGACRFEHRIEKRLNPKPDPHKPGPKPVKERQ